ncbi:MAG: PadR family transcriptional regulator [Anaerolineales bacterium]
MAQRDHHIGNLSPELALLGFLIAKPSHGYDLHQRFVVELGHVWHMSQSQAYAILKRLEQRGDINGQIVEQDKLPARQMLRITVQGRRRFNEWMDDISANSRSIRLEFLTRIYFARIHKPEKVAQIHEAQCNEIKLTIERLEALFTNLPPEQQFNHLSLDLRLRQMKLIQEWMMDVKTKIIDSKE